MKGKPIKENVVDFVPWDDLFAMFLAPRHLGGRLKSF